MPRCYQYRLYPTRAQADKLVWTLDRCRELYNAALEERREAYLMCGASVGYYEQKRQLPAIKEVPPRVPADGLSSVAGRDAPPRFGLPGVLSALRAQLMPQLSPKYVALLAKRYVLDRPALGVFDVPPRTIYPDVPPRTIYPDVHAVALDVHEAVAGCFALVGYERLIDYSMTPPPPELSRENARWVETTLRAAGYHPGPGGGSTRE